MMNKKQIVSTIALLTLCTPFIAGATESATGVEMTTTAVETTSAPMAVSVEVGGVDFIDSKTLSVAFNGALPGGVAVDSDVKLFRDMAITQATKNLDDAKKVTLELSQDFVQDGSMYNLFSVTATEGSIDFAATAETATYANPDTTSALTSVMLVSPTTLELTFNADLVENEFEFKLLKEVKQTGLFFDGTHLNVSLEKSLGVNTNYFFMFLSLKDEAKNEIEVVNSMYDFLTPATFKDLEESMTASGEVVAEETPVMTEVVNEETPAVESESMTGSVEETTPTEELPIEEVAATVDTTPDTWAKTNILLALTLLLSLGYFVARKKAQA